MVSSGTSQRRIRCILSPQIEAAAATPGMDRYRKRFPALAHLWVLVLHIMWSSLSLRLTHARLSTHTRWWQRWGMTRWISLSQLARSSTSRPRTGVDALLRAVLDLARRQPVTDPLWFTLRRLVVLDSTFVHLSACLSPWSVHGGHEPGVRLQALMELASQIPAHLHWSLADVNDAQALRELDLTPWRGWTMVLDRGYYGHPQFARLRAAGVHLLARFNEQVRYHIREQRPVPIGRTPDGDEILSDWRVDLGSPNNRRAGTLPEMRLVSCRNRAGTIHRFVTDRHDLSATEIVQLYRKRWQIELFFRWLKQQLGLVRPLGQSRAAVWLTILMVCIVAVIALLAEAERPPSMSRIAWLQHLALALLIEAIEDG
jgi:hypothetical protein